MIKIGQRKINLLNNLPPTFRGTLLWMEDLRRLEKTNVITNLEMFKVNTWPGLVFSTSHPDMESRHILKFFLHIETPLAFRVFRAACKYWVHNTSSIPVNDAKAFLDVVSIYMANVEPDEGFFLPTRSGTLPGPGDMTPDMMDSPRNLLYYTAFIRKEPPPTLEVGYNPVLHPKRSKKDFDAQRKITTDAADSLNRLLEAEGRSKLGLKANTRGSRSSNTNSKRLKANMGQMGFEAGTSKGNHREVHEEQIFATDSDSDSE